MYFYDSNKAVGGCEYKDPYDAGNLEFDWLEVQLNTFRSRNMKVWLTGHIPPSSGNYFPECYVRYVEMSLRFQDTIVGHLYGHQNADHFYFLQADDLDFWEDPQISGKKGLFDTIIDNFSHIPKASKVDYNNYAVVNVAPSVVPNPYLPTFRIFSYNITGMKTVAQAINSTGRLRTTKNRTPKHPRGGKAGNKEKLCKKKKYRDTWKCRLREPWNADEEAPSRSNTLWSPLGYTQYYIPDLGSANKTHPPKFKLEYLTFDPTALHPQNNETSYHYPVPLRNLPRSLRNTTIVKSKYAPYRMNDLTIPSWVNLARKLAKPKKKKLRKRFKKYMFMGGEEA
ncbi:hypothetical protein PILCRDRAFT_811290 [Piloderma croceum F 1598]|uniref:Calcineurin-like phosphoesterase domain-containing protein n=1 Tax=Piloderma croceum (strain F 1598) TaxID=765440 RepID=A0A0C3GGN1_PILCF|nr:hypothetical protein PILCRDRAFT_811290 [Piloderma croceum F 1598]